MLAQNKELQGHIIGVEQPSGLGSLVLTPPYSSVPGNDPSVPGVSCNQSCLWSRGSR